jgi:hypothetical protein
VKIVILPFNIVISLFERKPSSAVFKLKLPEYTLISLPSVLLLTLNPFELTLLLYVLSLYPFWVIMPKLPSTIVILFFATIASL